MARTLNDIVPSTLASHHNLKDYGKLTDHVDYTTGVTKKACRAATLTAMHHMIINARCTLPPEAH